MNFFKFSITSLRYYYNAGIKQCQLFNYNGCSGNGNNFATLGSCQNYCNSAGQSDWLRNVSCSLWRTIGLQDVRLVRVFIWTPSVSRFTPVIHPYPPHAPLGIHVGLIRWISEMFAVVDHLEVYILKWEGHFTIVYELIGVCPANERSYIDVGSQSPKTCFPNVANSCPTSYLCRLNQNLNKFYCCAPPSGGILIIEDSLPNS